MWVCVWVSVHVGECFLSGQPTIFFLTFFFLCMWVSVHVGECFLSGQPTIYF